MLDLDAHITVHKTRTEHVNQLRPRDVIAHWLIDERVLRCVREREAAYVAARRITFSEHRNLGRFVSIVALYIQAKTLNVREEVIGDPLSEIAPSNSIRRRIHDFDAPQDCREHIKALQRPIPCDRDRTY
ncbi:hypothetical protein [Rhizobium sp. LEGMi166a]